MESEIYKFGKSQTRRYHKRALKGFQSKDFLRQLIYLRSLVGVRVKMKLVVKKEVFILTYIHSFFLLFSLLSYHYIPYGLF